MAPYDTVDAQRRALPPQLGFLVAPPASKSRWWLWLLVIAVIVGGIMVLSRAAYRKRRLPRRGRAERPREGEERGGAPGTFACLWLWLHQPRAISRFSTMAWAA